MPLSSAINLNLPEIDECWWVEVDEILSLQHRIFPIERRPLMAKAGSSEFEMHDMTKSIRWWFPLLWLFNQSRSEERKGKLMYSPEGDVAE